MGVLIVKVVSGIRVREWERWYMCKCQVADQVGINNYITQSKGEGDDEIERFIVEYNIF